MKNKALILAKSRYFFCVLLLVAFTSCRKAEPIENYKGSIVCEKTNTRFGTGITLKCKSNDSKYDFKTIYVLESDWNKYEVGDTIK